MNEVKQEKVSQWRYKELKEIAEKEIDILIRKASQITIAKKEECAAYYDTQRNIRYQAVIDVVKQVLRDFPHLVDISKKHYGDTIQIEIDTKDILTKEEKVRDEITTRFERVTADIKQQFNDWQKKIIETNKESTFNPKHILEWDDLID